MPDKLEIIIKGVDLASGVFRQVGGVAASTMRGVAEATAGSASGWGRASAAIEQHATAIRTAGVATTAFGATLTGVLGSCIAEANEGAIAQAKLASAIQGSGQAIDQARLERLADQLQKVTTFSDDATIEMMAMLASFGLTQNQIEQLAPRVQNIAALMGTDLHSAAIAVGKAISTGNVGALQRYGIVIDEATKKSGDFNGMLKAMDRNTGDAAVRLGKTLPGAATIAANQLHDLQQTVGTALAPALTSLVKAATPVVGVFKSIAESPVGPVLIGATVAVAGLASILGPFLVLLPSLAKGWRSLSVAQLENARAAEIAAAANTKAATAAGVGGTAAAGASVVAGAGRAVGTAEAVGGAAAGAGLWAGIKALGVRGAAKAVGRSLIGEAGLKGLGLRGAAKLGGKALGRLIPYAGWGLLAYDIYGAGKSVKQAAAAAQAGPAGAMPSGGMGEEDLSSLLADEDTMAGVALQAPPAGAFGTTELTPQATTASVTSRGLQGEAGAQMSPDVAAYWEDRRNARAAFLSGALIPVWSQMTPGQRDAWMKDLTPEERAAVKARTADASPIAGAASLPGPSDQFAGARERYYAGGIRGAAPEPEIGPYEPTVRAPTTLHGEPRRPRDFFSGRRPAGQQWRSMQAGDQGDIQDFRIVRNANGEREIQFRIRLTEEAPPIGPLDDHTNDYLNDLALAGQGG